MINNHMDNYNLLNIAEGTRAGNQLIIHGNYQGLANAQVMMNAVLGDAQSSTDQFVVGGHANGNTRVYVNRIGGEGADTGQMGIKLIDVTSSEVNAFNLSNTLMSGAYEYQLYRNQVDQDWYLSSSTQPNIVSPIQPEKPVPIYRPDLGNHIANMESVVKSQIPSFGNQSSGALASGAGGLRAAHLMNSSESGQLQRSVWNVTTSNTSKGQAMRGQIQYDYDMNSSLIGVDTSFNAGNGLFQVGLMTGLTRADTDAHNAVTLSKGIGEVKGKIFGIYGSWYLDQNSVLSPFIDVSISYGDYNNQVKTLNNQTSHYKSNLWSTTLQGGYPISITSDLVIEPQFQLTYLKYDANDHLDHAGTHISQSLRGNLISRVGGYMYLSDQQFKPYFALNLWHDGVQSKVKYNGTPVSSDKAGFMLEAKAGLEAQLRHNFSITSEINYRQGQYHSKNYGGNIMLKYRF